MNIVIIDNESKHTRSILKLLKPNDALVINYKELDNVIIPKDNIVILSGGHSVPILWHQEQYKQEIDLIKNHDGPIIGICLGFEILAHYYGSHLHILDNKRNGEISLSSTGNHSFDIPKSVKVYESHNWSVLKLKKPLIPLAYSDDGIEIFRHENQPIYGMQFHPEESSYEAQEIFNQILQKLESSLIS